MRVPGTRRLARLLDCRHASRLISQAQDEALPLSNRLLLRLHLAWCDACRNFQRQAVFLRAAFRRYRM